jgi:predicted GNAT superfamily acetyltransferase
MIEYRAAEESHYPALLSLNEGAIPAVNRIDRGDLQHLHEQSRALIVALNGPAVAGFLLALDETAEYGSPNFTYFRRTYDRFVYVDRIVVSPDHRRLGIGAGLYRHLFDVARGAPRITCEVNVKPPNPGSLSFHEHLGFKVVDEQETENGTKRVALMVREGNP